MNNIDIYQENLTDLNRNMLRKFPKSKNKAKSKKPKKIKSQYHF